MVAKDDLDYKRAQVFALVYLIASVQEGVARIHPGVHGLYETWLAAEDARTSKQNPKDYYICSSHWRVA